MRQLRPGHRDRGPDGGLPEPGRTSPTPTATSGRSPSRWASSRADDRGRGPAAPARAAGPRRGGPPVRALRPRRGRRPGGAARGGGAVAGRRPGRPEGLADHGRLPPADRPAARRAGPAAAGGQLGAAGAAPGRRRAGRAAGRRLAGAAVPVLPPVAVAGLADRADPAGGRRPGHGRDRPGLPGARGDDDPADHPGQADDPGLRGRAQRAAVPAAAGGRARGPARCRPARALPDLQRGLRRHRGGSRCSAPSWRPRRSG